MKIKLSATQHRRLLKLLYMKYTPEEIASETEIPLIEIEQSFAFGCPHEIDENGVWIVGTDFQEWLGIKFGSSKKRSNPRGLINRDNFREVKAFLEYRIRVLQLDPKSVRNRWIELRHLLQWAGPIRLMNGATIEPFLPAYLATARNDGKDKSLGFGMHKRICMGSRVFFEWAKQEYSTLYSPVPDAWIKAIRPSKSMLNADLPKREAWELEDVRKIAALSVQSLDLKRAQAAICFLFLSGMRITAFITLPISCVDISNRRIEQNPRKGVQTKNHKASMTTLLPLPELLQVVKDWDSFVRTQMPVDTSWFAHINNNNQLVSPEHGVHERVNGRRMACIRGMKEICTLAGITYKSPHKLRHGHAIYGIKHARDIRELKAVSQNLMHSSISITDGIYGNLNNEDLYQTIAGLDRREDASVDSRAIIQALIALQNNPDLVRQLLTGSLTQN